MTQVFQPASAGTLEICLPPHLRKPRLRRSEASEYLAIKHGVTIATSTLAKWATQGGGPLFSKVNRTPLYATAHLDSWITEKLGAPMRSTSETAEAP